MRIAIVSFEYPPFAGGGIGTYTDLLAEHLSAEHEVHVVTNSWGADSPPGVNQCGQLSVHRLAALTIDYKVPPTAPERESAVWAAGGPALRWSVMAADCLGEIHRQHRLEVAEFPECFAEAHVALRRRRCGVDLVDLPMSVTLHTPIWEHHTYNLLPRRDALLARRARMEDECILWADRLSSPSRALRDLIYQRLGIDAESHPCDIIPYAVPTFERATPAAGAFPWLADGRMLLFVGRLEARKGVDTLIEAAVPILQEHRDVRLVVVGNSGDVGAQPGRMIDWLKSQGPTTGNGSTTRSRGPGSSCTWPNPAIVCTPCAPDHPGS